MRPPISRSTRIGLLRPPPAAAAPRDRVAFFFVVFLRVAFFFVAFFFAPPVAELAAFLRLVFFVAMVNLSWVPAPHMGVRGWRQR